MVAYRQIRASFNAKNICVYQAYSDEIADNALSKGTFSSPFKFDRMTWIKPSFLWTMYRSGWGEKDSNQKRILAIDISRKGFEWALYNSSLSHFENKFYKNEQQWREIKNKSPVRIQWDPERNLLLEPQEYRSIQIGLSNEAVNLYVHEWIQKISDITNICRKIQELVINRRFEEAERLLPKTNVYPLNRNLMTRIGVY
jgi:Domain of unknown function (DUF4291)